MKKSQPLNINEDRKHKIQWYTEMGLLYAPSPGPGWVMRAFEHEVAVSLS